MSSRVPSLNWLRVFEAAARTESFARAGRALNMSAAAVSQQIKALEAHLGQPLFARRAHAVHLTEAGRAYLPGVQQSLQLLEASTEGLFGTRSEQPLYVQSVLLFAHGILAPKLAGFTAANPDIRLILSTGNVPADFGLRFNDLQIVFGPPSAYGAAHDTLLSERLFPVASPDIAAEIDTAEDLIRFPLIEVATHRAGWPHVLDSLRLPAHGARLTFADSTVMAATLAAHGLGIALARAPASDLAVAQAGLVPCLPDISIAGHDSYHLVYDDLASLRPAARRFRDWLLDIP
ncbi:MAG: LysR family transcriptional regulator [Aestuariivita sp.]|uniref:LysR family transcriptional regulator n=1 Tax=Aestuariivita sp. TaxID=1872407 RepID=UPI003BAEF34C